MRKLPGSALLAMTLMVTGHAAAEPPSPAGMWVTIDDHSGKPTAVVEVALREGEVIGTVRKIYPQPGDDPDPRCEKCAGERKDQRVMGMQILWGMKKSDDGYGGGHI